MSHGTAVPVDGPTLDPGLTVLERPALRSTALHNLVVAQLANISGETLWVDARSNASTYALYERAPSEGYLDGVRIARAFTAYQHHSLVRNLLDEASQETEFIVVPCTASLYKDDDIPDHVGEGLLDSSVALLRELADALDVPVLATTPAADRGFNSRVVDAADATIVAKQTNQGLRFDGQGYETTVYYHDDHFQTTIPYWVDLCGCVCESDQEPAPYQVPLPTPEV